MSIHVTPHMVVETVLEHRASDMWRSKRAMSMVLGLIGRATLFEFGPTHPAMEHKEFALDMYERGLFTLPYPVTAFSFSGIPNPNQYVASQRAAGAMMVLSTDDDGRISAIMCTEMRAPDGRSMGAIPFGLVLRAKLSNPHGGSVDVNEETYPLVDDRMMAAIYGSSDAAGHDTMRNRLCSNMVACMGMTVMLMSKGVVTERHEAPVKLNKAREKKGKPRINDRYVVRVDPAYARVVDHGDGSVSDISGHSRGSPRPHWRRGHFRTIYRGQEQERVVPVAPALIAANPDSDVTRAVYRLARSA